MSELGPIHEDVLYVVTENPGISTDAVYQKCSMIKTSMQAENALQHLVTTGHLKRESDGGWYASDVQPQLTRTEQPAPTSLPEKLDPPQSDTATLGGKKLHQVYEALPETGTMDATQLKKLLGMTIAQIQAQLHILKKRGLVIATHVGGKALYARSTTTVTAAETAPCKLVDQVRRWIEHPLSPKVFTKSMIVKSTGLGPKQVDNCVEGLRKDRYLFTTGDKVGEEASYSRERAAKGGVANMGGPLPPQSPSQMDAPAGWETTPKASPEPATQKVDPHARSWDSIHIERLLKDNLASAQQSMDNYIGAQCEPRLLAYFRQQHAQAEKVLTEFQSIYKGDLTV